MIRCGDNLWWGSARNSAAAVRDERKGRGDGIGGGTAILVRGAKGETPFPSRPLRSSTRNSTCDRGETHRLGHPALDRVVARCV